MAVDPTTLAIRITGTEYYMEPTRTYARLTYQVFHAPTGAVLTTQTIQASVASAAQIPTVDANLVNQAMTEFGAVKWQYGSNASLGGYSPFDVSLMLERWTFQANNGNWNLSHPLSGTFNDVAIAGTPFPAIIDRAAAIVARVLPPPVWAWASSPEAGKLSANCVAVAGATSYNVYGDNGDGTYTLLGSAPTAAGGTVDVAAGYYRVRMAGVVGGVVGILSKATPVTVS